MTQLFSNNASGMLAASIDDVDTVIQVASGFGALFPSPGAGQFFLVSLENEDGDIEICRCTGRASDLLTVVRGQEGTAAQSWTNGQARVENRLTKETLEEFIQRSGDFMEGNLDMDGHNLIDAHLTGTGTKILAGEIVNVPLRGLTGVSTNEIAVPVNGTSRATAGGSDILVDGDDVTDLVDFTGYARLDESQQWTKSQATTPSALAIVTGAVEVDLSLSNRFTLTLTANCTLSNPTNGLSGQDFTIYVRQDDEDEFTLAFGNAYRWPNGLEPDTIPAGEAMLLVFSRVTSPLRYLGTAITGYDP